MAPERAVQLRSTNVYALSCEARCRSRALPSRIILAADAFDALISDRPYRPAQTGEEALAELAAHSGGQFDPACIAVLSQLVGR